MFEKIPQTADQDFDAPLIETEPVPVCPVCGGTDTEVAAANFDFEMQTCANEWIFKICDHCGCVRLDPRPAISSLPIIYPKTYYAYDLEERISWLAKWGKRVLDRLKFRSIIRAVGDNPRSYMDVGFGDGRYLRYFASLGIDPSQIFGLELSDELVTRARADGFQAFCTRIETCDQVPPGSLDLISIFHVIEHVDDPGAVVSKLGAMLADGGVLALETPNTSAVDARWFRKRYWGGYHTPRHWVLFDESTIKKLLENRGFDVIAIKYQTGHSFWMYSFHHALKYGDRLRFPWLAQWFDPMRSIFPLMFFTGLDIVRRTLGFRTSSMLVIAVKKSFGNCD